MSLIEYVTVIFSKSVIADIEVAASKFVKLRISNTIIKLNSNMPCNMT